VSAQEILLALLRLLPAGVATALALRWARGLTGSRARGVLLAFVVLQVVVVAQAELLGAFAAYRASPLVTLWVATAALFALLPRHRSAPALRPPLDRTERAVLALVLAVLAGTLVTALAAAPNTWDALTYHLPRVMHWIQNESLAHYPTSIGRQLKMPPLAELIVSQTVLLTGGDRLVALVPWTASALSALAVFLLVRGRGLSRLAGLHGALFFLTAPMAILQASGAKNGLVMCANLAAAAVFFADASRRPDRLTLGAGSVALGLAVLTQGVAPLFGGLLGLGCVVAVARRHGAARALAAGGAIALAILSLNALHWSRNLRHFGSLVGPTSEGRGWEYGNSRHDFGVLASNLTRNVALHFESPSPALNRRLEAAVTAAHERLGLRLDDPATTWRGAKLRIKRYPSRREASSGNPLHLLAILGALAVVPTAVRRAPHGAFAAQLALGMLAAALAFSLLLRWQGVHSRLHLPFFLAGAVLLPLVAWRRERFLAALSLALFTTSLPTLLANHARPLLGERSVLLRSHDADLLGGHAPAARRLADRLAELRPPDLGLHLGIDDPEYLVWHVARRASPATRLRHLFAGPPVAGDATAVPVDFVVTLREREDRAVLRLAAGDFCLDRRAGRFSLWRRAEERPGAAPCADPADGDPA